MKKWTTGELQALRAASRFLLGLGILTIIVSIWLFSLSFKLTPEQKSSPVHTNDRRDVGIALVVALAAVGAGWKLGCYVKKCEAATGQSAKPFRWMP
jgi:hypothetical protein